MVKNSIGVRLKHSGSKIADEIKIELSKQNFSKEAMDDLNSLVVSKIDNYTYSFFLEDYINCELLPEHLEELITLRIERHQIYVISGIKETFDNRFISFVSVAFPFMYWELDEEHEKFEEKKNEKETRSDSISFANFDELDSFFDFYHEDELSYPFRFYLPVFAAYIQAPINNRLDHLRRKEILVYLIKLLCNKYGFKLCCSESGDIPKEIPDECINPDTLNVYYKKLAKMNEALAQDMKNKTLWFKKASLLLSRDDTQSAIDCLTRSLNLDPDYAQAWYALSDAYSRLGLEKKANNAEEKAIELAKKTDISPRCADIVDFSIIYVPDRTPFHDKLEEDEYYTYYKDILICEWCMSDFVYTEDNVTYVCNSCNREDAIDGGVIGIELNLNKIVFKINNKKAIWLNINICNINDFDLIFKVPECMEFVLYEVTDEEKINENLEPIDYSKTISFGWPTIGIRKVKLKPNENKQFKVDITKIDWVNNLELNLLSPGHYLLDLFFYGEVKIGKKSKDTHTTSKPIFLKIIE